ncbi:hypothetical protein [Mesorhizobium sp. WSM3864]|uniref:hypothetical protein n=1 Tax=Mesorhizobium sp. WSM3864 TaxID=2029404 RepID=UPI001140C2CE|nr:hypothetical protein [Mesorhizobium sp. WSM3864]
MKRVFGSSLIVKVSVFPPRVRSFSEEGDIVHPLPIDGAGEPAERQIAEAAKLAAQAMCPRSQRRDMSFYSLNLHG